jgi:hypothetical protein
MSVQLTQPTFPNSRRNDQFCLKIGMDPATIAGLVLGVSPLIISAVENYETVFQPFVTYRRYSREIAKFVTRLDAQKAIFNNQCQLLLLTAEKDGLPEDVILDNILKDPRHPSRSDRTLNSHLEDLLGASVKTCVSTLRLIQQTLDGITRETKGSQELSNKKVSRTYSKQEEVQDDDDDINLRPWGVSETDSPRPPEGYRDALSWGIVYK